MKIAAALGVEIRIRGRHGQSLGKALHAARKQRRLSVVARAELHHAKVKLSVQPVQVRVAELLQQPVHLMRVSEQECETTRICGS